MRFTRSEDSTAGICEGRNPGAPEPPPPPQNRFRVVAAELEIMTHWTSQSHAWIHVRVRDERCFLLLLPTGTPVPDECPLRARAKITSAFRIPSAPHLRLGLNLEILNVGTATPPIPLNRPIQI